MKKIAIVVGHNKQSQGAVRKDTGETEFSYNSRLAKYIKAASDNDVEVFFRQKGGGYVAELARVYNDTDRWKADVTVELHFNSAGTPNASGTETFSSGSRKSLILAEEVQMEMVDELGLNDRGIKIRNSRTKGRGYRSLVLGDAPAILIEPFFGSSTKGQQATDSDFEQQRLAEAIAEGINNALERF